MPGFVAKMESFGGRIPAIDDRLLPDNQASVATNTWLFSGRIEPTHSLVPLFTPAKATRSWFRLPRGNPSIDTMANSDWLEFQNQNIRVIKSPVSGQEEEGRYYWADGIYPKYITGDGIRTHKTPYRLGVPFPTEPPGVASSGGVSTVNTTRSYVYTWVTGLSEEGPPSFPTLHTGKLDDVWQITFTAPGASDVANRNLTRTRIYRTLVSSQGIATYYFVDEIPIAQLAYTDTNSDPEVAANDQLKTLFWMAPPEDLQGLVSMPNGMIAAWRENEIWFCEPYFPHAWPSSYVIAVPNKIVGLGVYNQSVIILTEGQPYAATGVDPASMALAIIQPLMSCTSRNSIVSTPNGVLYSAPNGLINITPGGAQNVTMATVLKDQWDELLHLDTIAASIIMGGYYAYSLDQQGAFQQNTFQDDAFQMFKKLAKLPGAYLSLIDARIGVNVLDTDATEVQNVITDIFNGETMLMRDGVIYLVDIRKQDAAASYLWRSKIWVLPYVQNLGAVKIYWTPPFDPDAPATIFRMYASEVADQKDSGLPLKYERTLAKSGTMFRLPSGFKAMYFQFEVEGYALISSIHVGQSPRDLRQI